MPPHLSPTVAPTPAADPRFRTGSYITDGQHLYWVRRANLGPMLQDASVLVVEDCKTNVVLELDLARVATTCTLVRSESAA
ncbi:MAG: hypothetical protein QOJ25_3356 [Solirubrobacteraceae bacterium]|nr:hypothetical protein [Solirubrobacteraceae bacterium]